MKCLVLIFPFIFFLARMNWLVGSGFLFENLMSQSYSSFLPYVIPEGWLLCSRETCYRILIWVTWIQSTSTTPFREKKYFNFILASLPTWSVWFLPFRCTNQNIIFLRMPSVPATCSIPMVLHELTVLIVFVLCKEYKLWVFERVGGRLMQCTLGNNTSYHTFRSSYLSMRCHYFMQLLVWPSLKVVVQRGFRKPRHSFSANCCDLCSLVTIIALKFSRATCGLKI